MKKKVRQNKVESSIIWETQARKLSYGGKDGGLGLSYLIQDQQRRQD